MTAGNLHPSPKKVSTGLSARVEGRFGILPNFFRLAPETPEITEKLWGFAQAAYLDNPMPSIFKERLFVYLSRFCAVRYCIARHVGFLVGLGRPAGDAAVQPQQHCGCCPPACGVRFPARKNCSCDSRAA